MIDPSDTAVMMIVFNRPEQTRKVFERIREAKPKRLYIAADGIRPNRPDDVASTIAFLLGRESAYVTGQNIIVDGGFAASILSHIPGQPGATKSTTPGR